MCEKPSHATIKLFTFEKDSECHNRRFTIHSNPWAFFSSLHPELNIFSFMNRAFGCNVLTWVWKWKRHFKRSRSLRKQLLFLHNTISKSVKCKPPVNSDRARKIADASRIYQWQLSQKTYVQDSVKPIHSRILGNLWKQLYDMSKQWRNRTEAESNVTKKCHRLRWTEWVR